MNGGGAAGDHSHSPQRHEQRGRTGFNPQRHQEIITQRTPSSTITTTAKATTKGKQKSVRVVVRSRRHSTDDTGAEDNADHDHGDDDDEVDDDTVGSLLAEIATILADALRMLIFADKRHWDSDEFEQVRALEEMLDEAKADFQELGPLLKGSFYYENDRRPESLDELRTLRAQLTAHSLTFKEWLRRGGPINALWVRDTLALRTRLHRAQRKAAARIYASQQADIAGNRCLGAFEVLRRQRRLEDRRRKYDARRRTDGKYESTRDELSRAEAGELRRVPSWQQDTPTMSALGTNGGEVMEMGSMGGSPPQQQQKKPQHNGQTPPQASSEQAAQYSQQPDALEAEAAALPDPLEELVPVCNMVGHVERFGDRDVAFSCDFCSGFIVWEDLARLPSTLDATALDANVTAQPNWQAKGTSMSTAEAKAVVFAPLAIANHVAPELGDWQARLLCPYCDEYDYYEAGDEDETRYVQDEKGFGSLREFQEHLEWYHTSVAVPSLPAAAKNCVVM